MKYENFMKKYVLQPAGCYDMHIAGTYYKDRRPNETKYYMHQGSIPVYEYNNSGRMVESVMAIPTFLASPVPEHGVVPQPN